MKTKALFLTLAIMASSILAFSHPSEPVTTKTDCDKKVLNKIKRKIGVSNFVNYLEEGTSAKFLVTCSVNDQNEVELVNIEGNNQILREKIIKTFDKHTIACPNETPGSTFTFWLNLKKMPA